MQDLFLKGQECRQRVKILGCVSSHRVVEVSLAGETNAQGRGHS